MPYRNVQTTADKEKQQIKSREENQKKQTVPPPQTCTETYTNTYTLVHTLTHIRTQTHTLTPTHTLAVTKETWLSSETCCVEEATFGGPTTLGEISVQGRRECHHRDHPNPGIQETPHQDAEPSSHPGWNCPRDSTPAARPGTTPSLAGPHEEPLEIKKKKNW